MIAQFQLAHPAGPDHGRGDNQKSQTDETQHACESQRSAGAASAISQIQNDGESHEQSAASGETPDQFRSIETVVRIRHWDAADLYYFSGKNRPMEMLGEQPVRYITQLLQNSRPIPVNLKFHSYLYSDVYPRSS